MNRSAIIYLAAVLAPCGLLGWIGWRAAEREAVETESRRIAYYQKSADGAAAAADDAVQQTARDFREAVEALGSRPDHTQPALVDAFLRGRLPTAEAVFVLGPQPGDLVWSGATDETAAVIEREADFLSGSVPADCAVTAWNDHPALPADGEVTVVTAGKPMDALSAPDRGQLFSDNADASRARERGQFLLEDMTFGSVPADMPVEAAEAGPAQTKADGAGEGTGTGVKKMPEEAAEPPAARRGSIATRGAGGPGEKEAKGVEAEGRERVRGDPESGALRQSAQTEAYKPKSASPGTRGMPDALPADNVEPKGPDGDATVVASPVPGSPPVPAPDPAPAPITAAKAPDDRVPPARPVGTEAPAGDFREPMDAARNTVPAPVLPEVEDTMLKDKQRAENGSPLSEGTPELIAEAPADPAPKAVTANQPAPAEPALARTTGEVSVGSAAPATPAPAAPAALPMPPAAPAPASDADISAVPDVFRAEDRKSKNDVEGMTPAKSEGTRTGSIPAPAREKLPDNEAMNGRRSVAKGGAGVASSGRSGRPDGGESRDSTVAGAEPTGGGADFAKRKFASQEAKPDAKPGNDRVESASNLAEPATRKPYAPNDDISAGLRVTEPLHIAPDPRQRARSSVSLRASRFDEITRQGGGGITSRFADGVLSVIFWHRPSWHPEYVIGVVIGEQKLRALLKQQVDLGAPDEDAVLRLVDHRGGAVEDTRPGGRALVAREIGPSLPLWEAAVFLTRADALGSAGTAARWRLALSVLAVLSAGVAGAVLLLRDARRTARDARLKVDFVSNVSHELKTPLTSIRMFSDLLAADAETPPEKRKRYAETIASESARLSRLISNVLDFARLERGERRLERERVDLREMLVQFAESHLHALERDGFKLVTLLPAAPVMILADRDALSQILLNLLGNAQKYGHCSGGPREITLTLSPGSKEAVVTLADRGPGVPAGHEKKVFRQFHRAHDGVSSTAAGTGLGLPIACGLAAAHGGTLTYHRREGGGAVFRLAIPAA